MSDARVLYLDDDCVVFNKKAGEAVEGAGAGMVLLTDTVRSVLGESPFLEACHRLDVPVSGCVLLARNARAAAALNAAFAERKVRKTYWAVAEKRDDKRRPEARARLVHYLNFDPATNKSRVHAERRRGLKEAVLEYRLVGEGDNYFFLEIELITGRHHQIRAQLAAAGFPVKGDLKYGARRSEKGGGLRLHCRTLVFPLGLDGEGAATAPVPEADSLWNAFEAAVAANPSLPGPDAASPTGTETAPIPGAASIPGSGSAF